MTFRSLATLQGGTPAETGDTAGEPAGTKFVALGEPLTAARYNRPMYALAENTDDLDARLGSIEASGLDAAYDLLGVGAAGGGRVINATDGAVEILYDDSDPTLEAGLRTTQVVGAGLGYDAVGRHTASQFGGGYGHRLPIALAHHSIIAVGQAATLNPGGVAPSVVKLSGGGRWWVTDEEVSDVISFVDLLEISGSSSDDGVYIIGEFNTGDNTEANLHLFPTGTAATFSTADEAVTVTFHRFSILVAGATAQSRGGVQIQGIPDYPNALEVRAGGIPQNPDMGAENAIAVFVKNIKNQASTQFDDPAFLVDGFGAVLSRTHTDLYTGLEAEFEGSDGTNQPTIGRQGVASFKSDKRDGWSSLNDIAFMSIWEGKDADRSAWANLHLYPVTEGGLDGTAQTVNLASSVANSAAVDMVSIMTAAQLQGHALSENAFMEIVTPAENAGVYRITSAGGTSIAIESIDHQLGDINLTTGNITMRVLRAMEMTGVVEGVGGTAPSPGTAFNPNDASFGIQTRTSAKFSALEEDEAVALMATAPGVDATGATRRRFLFKGVTTPSGGSQKTVAYIDNYGDMAVEGALMAASLNVTGGIGASGSTTLNDLTLLSTLFMVDDIDVISGGEITTSSGDFSSTSGDFITGSGNIEATGGSVTAGNGVTATAGNITATAGDITAPAGGFTAGSDIIAGGDFLYAATVPINSKRIFAVEFTYDEDMWQADNDFDAGPAWGGFRASLDKIGAAKSAARYIVRLPSGSTVTGVDVAWNVQSSIVGGRIVALSQTSNFSATGTATERGRFESTATGLAVESLIGPGASGPFTQFSIDHTGTTFTDLLIHVEFSAAATSSVFRWVEVFFEDPGPRNY